MVSPLRSRPHETRDRPVVVVRERGGHNAAGRDEFDGLHEVTSRVEYTAACSVFQVGTGRRAKIDRAGLRRVDCGLHAGHARVRYRESAAS